MAPRIGVVSLVGFGHVMVVVAGSSGSAFSLANRHFIEINPGRSRVAA